MNVFSGIIVSANKHTTLSPGSLVCVYPNGIGKFNRKRKNYVIGTHLRYLNNKKLSMVQLYGMSEMRVGKKK